MLAAENFLNDKEASPRKRRWYWHMKDEELLAKGRGIRTVSGRETRRTEGPKVEAVCQICKTETRTGGDKGEETRGNEVSDEDGEVSRRG